MKQQVPDQLKKLIPKRIEKGIYYRLYTLKDGSVRLIWWVKAWGKTGLPIYESSGSSRYEDAVKLKKKLISQVERGLRSGGNPDQGDATIITGVGGQ